MANFVYIQMTVTFDNYKVGPYDRYRWSYKPL